MEATWRMRGRRCGVASNRFGRELFGPLDQDPTVRIGSARSDRANGYERTWAVGFKMNRTAATYLRFFLLAMTARARAGRRAAETRRKSSPERDRLIGFDWALARNDEGRTRRSVMLLD